MQSKMEYQTPAIELIGSFEVLTQGQSTGSKFDGTFVIGQPVPFGPNGKPLIFS